MDQLAQTAQDKWQSEKDTAAHDKEHGELLIGLDRIQRATLQGHQASIAALASHEPSVTVKNPVESVATPDVDKVVKAVEALIRVEKARKDTDLKPVVREIKALLPAIKNISKEIEMPEATESVEVTNLGELQVILEDILLSLRLANEREAVEKEPITLKAPDVIVNEKETDLTPLIEAQNKVVEAVKGIEIPADDDTAVLSALASVDDAIRTLRFPVPNVPTDPTIKYRPADIDNVGTVKYFGFTDVIGNWYVMREDATSNPTTLRYVQGTTSYAAAWTNRAGLTYDYFHSAF